MSIEQESPPTATEPIFDIELYRELVHKLGGYERKYKVSSGTLANRIADGSLAETAEVCDWVESLGVLRALTNDW